MYIACSQAKSFRYAAVGNKCHPNQHGHDVLVFVTLSFTRYTLIQIMFRMHGTLPLQPPMSLLDDRAFNGRCPQFRQEQLFHCETMMRRCSKQGTAIAELKVPPLQHIMSQHTHVTMPAHGSFTHG
jgi:hypothetical protein